MQNQYPPPNAQSSEAVLQQQQAEEQMNQLLEAIAQMSFNPQVGSSPANDGQQQASALASTSQTNQLEGPWRHITDINWYGEPESMRNRGRELGMTAHQLTFGIEELGKRAVTVQANRAAKSQADLFKELTQIHKEIKGRKAMLIKVAQAIQTIGMMSTAPGGIGYHNGPAGQGTQSVNSMPGGQPTPNLYPPPSPPASHLATLIGVDPQEANQLVLLSNYPADELRRRGISGHIVDKVELHRAVLQRTLQGQTSFRNDSENSQMQ